MIESPRSTQKRKTFSIRNAFWVTGLIIDSVHFLTQKSTYFINWTQAAQLIRSQGAKP